MEITSNTSINPTETTTQQAPALRVRSLVWKVGRFSLHLLEMLVAMGAGMGLFHLLEGVLPTSSGLAAAFESGTTLHTIGMNVFMAVPMVAWMIFRGHGWRHSIEMMVAMLAPMAIVGLLCQLGVVEYLPWLAEAGSPAMFLGMLVAMIYRRSHYTGKASHSAHTAQPAAETPCH